ncbi:MAG: Fic family protein [Beijerinckiaceae bacterium]
MNLNKLTVKKRQLDSFRPLPFELVKNLDEWFKVELTYTSNALEGNTLTRRETAVVIEKGITIGGKSLIEHIEATNHAKAFDFIQSLVSKQPSEFTQADLLTLHETILKGIDDKNAGQYRAVSVRISGSTVILPNPAKVPDLMDAFCAWLQSAQDLHAVELASEAHYRLVTIHPFIDGNGRTARLLMNMLLMMQGYPPAIIRKRDRLAYITALEQAQMGGSKTDYERIIERAVDRSLDLMLNAIKGEVVIGDLDDEGKLLKIGELAKAAQESVPTIRHWVQAGLIEVAETTASNYQLFAPDMIKRCEEIKRLKQQRLTLPEIKTAFEQR